MKKLILVTGSHRSGSTWTGHVLSRADDVRYVNEPFNIGLSYKNSPFTFWFEYLADKPIQHQEDAQHYLNSFFQVICH